MRGRKPIPADRRWLTGNPGKRPLGEESAPSVSVSRLLTPPEALAGDAVAIAKWHERARLLLASGLLTDLDDDILMLYCQTWSTLVHARKHLVQADGEYALLEKTRLGNVVHSAYLAIATRATERLKSLANELGMTPQARSRVKTQIPLVPPADEFGEFDGPAAH